MIIPTKHLPINRSLLGVGAEVLLLLDRPKTISGIWDDFQAHRGENAQRIPFDWFIYSISMLYMLGAIHLKQGRLEKRSDG